jgi:putative SOS response-associated peptidase YedK
MCGRFTLRTPSAVLVRQFGLASATALSPRYNIAPSQEVAVVRLAGERQRELAFMRWGLVPSWADDPAIGNRMINARSETAADKPSFRGAFRRRRCLVVADGYYEWQKAGKAKQPYFFHFKDDAPLAFAGLFERWEKGESPLESCTILTTEACEVARPIHDRMPVILPASDYAAWLDPDADVSEVHKLLRPYGGDDLVTYPISTHVNRPANDDPRCIERLP